MTAKEFNNKYSAHLEQGHYGLSIDHPRLTEYLDGIFESLINIPGFKYSQIKMKFYNACFYSTLSPELNDCIERGITFLMTTIYNEIKGENEK